MLKSGEVDSRFQETDRYFAGASQPEREAPFYRPQRSPVQFESGIAAQCEEGVRGVTLSRPKVWVDKTTPIFGEWGFISIATRKLNGKCTAKEPMATIRYIGFYF